MQGTSSESTTVVHEEKPSTFQSIDGFTADSIPPHHYNLGEDNYVVVSDFGDVINVHIRKFRTDENGRIFPTQNGISFSPFVWETLHRIPLPSDSEKVVIINNTLFLTSILIENVPHVSLQRFVAKKDFSHQFLPSFCLISETEWKYLQCIRKKITESCKLLMFGNLLKKRIQLETLARSPRFNFEIGLDDVNMVLLTSLTEILSTNLMDRIEDLLICQGCNENQPNQLNHECVTMTYLTRHKLYGDLALFSINIELLVKDFVEKNIQMLNYINETFLNSLNVDSLIRNACYMYIDSDPLPYRLL